MNKFVIHNFVHIQLYLQDKFPQVAFLYKLKIIHL